MRAILGILVAIWRQYKKTCSSLHVGTLEAGHRWLPFWMARLDEHAEAIKAAPPELGHKPSEYVTGGRYVQSIEIPEGAKLTTAVIDLIGDHVLMYASDANLVGEGPGAVDPAISSREKAKVAVLATHPRARAIVLPVSVAAGDDCVVWVRSVRGNKD
jgi:hypothetical protein